MLEVTVGWDSWEMIKFAPSPVKMDEDLTYMRLAYYASEQETRLKWNNIQSTALVFPFQFCPIEIHISTL